MRHLLVFFQGQKPTLILFNFLDKRGIIILSVKPTLIVDLIKTTSSSLIYGIKLCNKFVIAFVLNCLLDFDIGVPIVIIKIFFLLLSIASFKLVKKLIFLSLIVYSKSFFNPGSLKIRNFFFKLKIILLLLSIPFYIKFFFCK